MKKPIPISDWFKKNGDLCNMCGMWPCVCGPLYRPKSTPVPMTDDKTADVMYTVSMDVQDNYHISGPGIERIHAGDEYPTNLIQAFTEAYRAGQASQPAFDPSNHHNALLCPHCNFGASQQRGEQPSVDQIMAVVLEWMAVTSGTSVEKLRHEIETIPRVAAYAKDLRSRLASLLNGQQTG